MGETAIEMGERREMECKRQQIVTTKFLILKILNLPHPPHLDGGLPLSQDRKKIFLENS